MAGIILWPYAYVLLVLGFVITAFGQVFFVEFCSHHVSLTLLVQYAVFYVVEKLGRPSVSTSCAWLHGHTHFITLPCLAHSLSCAAHRVRDRWYSGSFCHHARSQWCLPTLNVLHGYGLISLITHFN